MRRYSIAGFLTLGAVLCGGAAGAFAATTITALDPVVDSAAADAPALLSGAELEEVVAPIALYPDDLIAIVLPASTYPLQVVQAARFLEAVKSDTSLKPDEAWDDSIVALTNYPEVVDLLNRDLDWTWKLGQAVINQQADVLDAVKGFRERAHVAGNLESDERQVVEVTPEAIAIKPADPKVIYVPYYEPAQVTVVQRLPVYHYYPVGYPVYYYPYPADYTFGWPYFWGVSSFYSLGWTTHHVHVHHHHHHGHPYYSWRYWDRYWYRHSRPSYAYRSGHDHWNYRGGWDRDDWRRGHHDWRYDRHRGGARPDGWSRHDRNRGSDGDWRRRDGDRQSDGGWARNDSRGDNPRERSWATTTRSNPLPAVDRRPSANREARTFRSPDTFRSRWNADRARPNESRDRQNRNEDRPRRREYASRPGFQPPQRAQPPQQSFQPRQSSQPRQSFQPRQNRARWHSDSPRNERRAEAPRHQPQPRAASSEPPQHARADARSSNGRQRSTQSGASLPGRGGGNPRGDGGFRGGFRSHYSR